MKRERIDKLFWQWWDSCMLDCFIRCPRICGIAIGFSK